MKIVAVDVSEAQITYTPEGIQRLAKAIKATLKLRGWSERELHRQMQAAGSTIALGTVNRYAKGRPINPKNEVLREIAPFIYRVVSIDGDSVEVDPSRTYADDWIAFAKIGSTEFSNSNSH
ncbi:hypothetical protein H6G00_00870 [Leptolyngbya sp. FACHB-541]|uniref:hypothetical protein n=1 Tax=Leptolyngbya sp. FACHB-541 TaxID=2692810 RepID=UPI001687F2A0|nr:hypothetical protein [Leptolyngbya sp. FACHB-541]MBD1995180.1 hypothetical protein [Leptolyngbya sp. FACHB-541]